MFRPFEISAPITLMNPMKSPHDPASPPAPPVPPDAEVAGSEARPPHGGGAEADRRARTPLVRRDQDYLLHQEFDRQAAILNALPAHIALLDALGFIVSVNQAWRQFAGANLFRRPDAGRGLNYLEVCDRALGDDAAQAHQAHQAAAGIRAVLAGAADSFSLEYSCHSPSEQRWFLLTVNALMDQSPPGAVVMHLDITDRKQADQKFKALLEAAPDAMVIVNSNAEMVLVNARAVQMFGWRREELLGQPMELLVPERLRRQHAEKRSGFFAQPRARPMGADMALFGRRQDGSEFPIEVSLSPLETHEGTLAIAAIRDTTERKATERTIQHLNRVYAVLSGINTLIVRTHDRGELFQQACHIAVEAGGFRMAMIAVVAPGTTVLIPVASRGKDEALLRAIKTILASPDTAPTTMSARALREKRAVVSNDSQHDPQVVFGPNYAAAGVRAMAVMPLLLADDAVGVLALYAGEINFFQEEELKLLTELAGDIGFAMDHLDKQERLNYLAYYDALTGLANRTLFLERVAQYARSAASAGHRLGLFLVDLERFKNINDSLGRQVGDELLRQVAQWLTRNTAGDVNLLARVEADHFGVVMPVIQAQGNVVSLLQQWINAFLKHPFRLNDGVFRISLTVGVALFPDDGEDADTLFRRAEAALKKAKASGERYLFFTPAMTQAGPAKLTLENQLRQALDNEEFVLHYQPKVNLASGKMTSAEALIRWNDPRSGLVPPAQFIPILEETGLIHDVGRWALRQAIKESLRWRAAGLPVVRIAVNVSPRQLRNRGFIDEVRQAIAVDEQAANALELEITESLIMENVQHSIASLQAIRDMGLRIAIDDFGTGFSSLSYLSKFPVDTLKIDRSFVIEMTDSAQGLALVSTIISLAHALGLKVVAEGVETEEQARLLRVLNCEEMQGYLYSKPVPGDVFETQFLRRLPPG